MTDAAPTAALRRIEPPVGEAAQPFWDATRARRLVVQWCVPCDGPIFYPREVCPRCLGTELEWRPSQGHGTVYAASVQHRGPAPLPAYTEGPYVVALVELDEGIRMMSNVVGCEPDDVAVGMRVAVTWEALSDGRHLPLFGPVEEEP